MRILERIGIEKFIEFINSIDENHWVLVEWIPDTNLNINPSICAVTKAHLQVFRNWIIENEEFIWTNEDYSSPSFCSKKKSSSIIKTGEEILEELTFYYDENMILLFQKLQGINQKYKMYPKEKYTFIVFVEDIIKNCEEDEKEKKRKTRNANRDLYLDDDDEYDDEYDDENEEENEEENEDENEYDDDEYDDENEKEFEKQDLFDESTHPQKSQTSLKEVDIEKIEAEEVAMDAFRQEQLRIAEESNYNIQIDDLNSQLEYLNFSKDFSNKVKGLDEANASEESQPLDEYTLLNMSNIRPFNLSVVKS